MAASALDGSIFVFTDGFGLEGMLTLKQAMPIDLKRDLELNRRPLILLLELERAMTYGLVLELVWDMKQWDLIQLTH
jgi:hypothetical protein